MCITNKQYADANLDVPRQVESEKRAGRTSVEPDAKEEKLRRFKRKLEKVGNTNMADVASWV